MRKNNGAGSAGKSNNAGRGKKSCRGKAVRSLQGLNTGDTGNQSNERGNKHCPGNDTGNKVRRGRKINEFANPEWWN